MSHVSILLQTYNHARYLPACLDSLLGQSYRNFELIVVDDCSPDHTPEVLQPYWDHPKTRIIRNALNLGQHRSTNLHLDSLRGEFVLFAAGDDLYYPNYLQAALGAFSRYPTAAIVHVNGHIIDSQGQRRKLISHHDAYSEEARKSLQRDYFVSGQEFFERLLDSNLIISHSSCVVRRSALVETGPFDERLPQAGDWDMWLRLSLYGDVAYLSEPLMGWRRHTDSASVHFSRSGRRAQDLVTFACKLADSYPQKVQTATKNEPYILLLGFLGAAYQAYSEQQPDLIDHFLKSVGPFQARLDRFRVRLIVHLAVQAWYAYGDHPKEAIAFVQFACRQLATVTDEQLDWREVASHFYLLHGYKAWRGGHYTIIPAAFVRAMMSSPRYVLKSVAR